MKKGQTRGNRRKSELKMPACPFDQYIWAATSLILQEAIPVSRVYQVSVDRDELYTNPENSISVEIILNKEEWILTFEGQELILKILNSDLAMGSYFAFFPNLASIETRYTEKIINKPSLILTMEIEYYPEDKSEVLKAILTKT